MEILENKFFEVEILGIINKEIDINKDDKKVILINLDFEIINVVIVGLVLLDSIDGDKIKEDNKWELFSNFG